MIRRISIAGLTLILCFGALAAVSAGVLRSVQPVQVGEQIPQTAFIDQDGKPFTFGSLRGTPFVLAFVYTRCRDARECPLISAKFHLLQQQTKPGELRLVEVSIDPAFDRPTVLSKYARRFDADPSRWTFLTGDPQKVLDFALRFDVTAFADPHVGMIHNERTVVVDRDGTIRQLIDEVQWSPDEIVAQVRANQRLAANPIARLNLWLSSAAVAMCGNSVAGFSGFEDLLIVLAIFAVTGFLLYRLGRAFARSA